MAGKRERSISARYSICVCEDGTERMMDVMSDDML